MSGSGGCGVVVLVAIPVGADAEDPGGDSVWLVWLFLFFKTISAL